MLLSGIQYSKVSLYLFFIDHCKTTFKAQICKKVKGIIKTKIKHFLICLYRIHRHTLANFTIPTFILRIDMSEHYWLQPIGNNDLGN
jgi:hypothetical protein